MTVLLEVGIGLTLIFALASTLVSAIQEMFARWFNRRGRHLEAAMRTLLDGERPSACSLAGICDLARVSRKNLTNDSLAHQVLEHGLIRSLSDGNRLPSYVPAEIFADALIDLLQKRSAAPSPAEALSGGLQDFAVSKRATGTMVDNPFPPAEALRAIFIRAHGDVTAFRAGVVDWYNAAMDRVTGWYKRETQFIQFWIGLALAIGLNLDAFNLTTLILTDDALRKSLVLQAEKTVPVDPNADTSKIVGMSAKSIENLSLPLGWANCSISGTDDGASNPQASDGSDKSVIGRKDNCFSSDPWHNIEKVLGFWVAALALSLGAPFWFDLMQRLLNLRGGGVKPAESASPATKTTPPPRDLSQVPPTVPSSAPATPTVLNAYETMIGFTTDDIRQIQTKLNAPLSGILDSTTRDYIKRFQVLKAVPSDGYLTPDLVHALLEG